MGAAIDYLESLVPAETRSAQVFQRSSNVKPTMSSSSAISDVTPVARTIVSSQGVTSAPVSSQDVTTSTQVFQRSSNVKPTMSSSSAMSDVTPVARTIVSSQGVTSAPVSSQDVTTS